MKPEANRSQGVGDDGVVACRRISPFQSQRQDPHQAREIPWEGDPPGSWLPEPERNAGQRDQS